jgi:3-phenylpropionate/trans-cinnamate dioxygenase ferredoxin reductase subunit
MGSFDNMMSLRDIADADRIMIAMEAAENIVIIGGGFIGLEIAATAAQQGKTVTVIEMQPGLLSRVMTPNATDHILQKHQSAGVKVRLNCRLTGFQSNGSRITEVETDSCPPISADLVIVGIGARANTALAAAAGLAVSNGVEVDEFCRTNGADVFAIGDCALAPTIYGESPVRLESVQNATDQAKAVAKTIAGDPTPYRDVPWFWSDQYDIKLQMAGLHHAGDHEVLRGDPESGRFSVCFLREGKLAAMHSVNQPADHMASRQLIAKQIPVTPQQLADPALRLKQLI